MKLFAGLGNPGGQYARNRHNIGFMAVERIASDHGFSPWRSRFQGQVSEGRLGSEKVVLLRPGTFMNLSGQSVRPARAALSIPMPHVTVFHDELDVAVGKIKGKQGGGAGGHNGIKSLDALMGKDYQRIRIGIGHPGHPDLVSDYVLSPPSPPERAELEKVVGALTEAFPALVNGEELPDIAGYLNEAAMILNPKPVKNTPLPDPLP